MVLLSSPARTAEISCGVSTRTRTGQSHKNIASSRVAPVLPDLVLTSVSEKLFDRVQTQNSFKLNLPIAPGQLTHSKSEREIVQSANAFTIL